jgi:hypothetical protein
MLQIKNNDNQTLEFDGKSEGLQIFSHIIANTAGNAVNQPNYDEITFDWKLRLRDGRTIQVFSGRLNLLFQTMLLLTNDITKRMQYLNGMSGQALHVAGGNIDKAIADLSFFHSVLDGFHSIVIRSGQVFKAGDDVNSFLHIDFNPSDDDPETPFMLRQDNIPFGSSVQTFRITGNVGGIVYVQSDNTFIASNTGAYNGQDEHPLALVTCSSPLFNSMLRGSELQSLLVDDVAGIPDFANSVMLSIQKSLVLSERDLLINPQLDLQINSASMVSGVSYNIVSKVFV